jgi:hypothetical protein
MYFYPEQNFVPLYACEKLAALIFTYSVRRCHIKRLHATYLKELKLGHHTRSVIHNCVGKGVTKIWGRCYDH